jgi:hypothetical protein
VSYEEDLEKRNAELEQKLEDAENIIQLLIATHVEAENLLFDIRYYEVENETITEKEFLEQIRPSDFDDLSSVMSDDPKIQLYIADYLEQKEREDDGY